MTPILCLEAALAAGEHLPQAPISLEFSDADFTVIEVPGPRRGAGLADMCCGLARVIGGHVRFLGRDWSGLPHQHADALRGHIGRLFHQPLQADTPDVATRVLLGQLYHTRIPERELRQQAADLALRFGLPGLPAGPARFLAEPDLLRAACVRAFLGQPRLIIVELPVSAQRDDLLPALLEAGAEARGRGAAVLWLATQGPVHRHPLVRPRQTFRLTESGLIPVRLPARAA